MPKKHVIAIDCSESTYLEESQTYWPNVSKHLENMNDQDASYVFWDDRENPSVVNQKEALERVKKADQRQRQGSARFSSFIQHLPSDKEGIDLSIFMNAQIDDSEVNRCYEILREKDIKIKKLRIFFIGDEKKLNSFLFFLFIQPEWIVDAGLFCEFNINEEIMQDYFKSATFRNVVAIDYSGSTCFEENKEYWPTVSKHIEAIKNQEESYVFWDVRMSPIIMNSNAEALKAAKEANSETCEYGTRPLTFIRHLAVDEEGINLTIFTDGRVNQTEVNRCEQLLKMRDIKIKKLCIFFIGPECIDSKEVMNLSVPAPFMRTERIPESGMVCVINKNGKIESYNLKASLSQQIENYFGNPELFLEDLPNLLKKIKLQNLGQKIKDRSFRDQLIRLKNNLLKVAAENKKSDKVQAIQADVMCALQNKDENSALEGIKKFLGYLDLNDEAGKNIEAGFQQVLTLLDKEIGFGFGEKISNRIIRAPEVKKENIDDAKAISSVSETKFACPITFGEDLPVLPIKASYQITNKIRVEKYPPILRDLSKNYQDFLINNPLAILGDPKLVAKIKERFDKVLGFNTIKQLHENKFFTSTFSKQSISSYISTSNEESHQKVTRYALADLFFGEKLQGVPELWLAVVYFIAKETESLNTEESFDGFINVFKENLMNQLKTNHTSMALSGLSTDGPLVKVPVALAVWYCIVASYKLDEMPNRLRALGTTYHLNLLDELDYPYDRKWTLHRLALYQVLAEMMKQVKINSTKLAGPKKLMKWVRSLYQNSMIINNTIVLLDGSSKNDSEARVSLENFENARLNENEYDKQNDTFFLTVSHHENQNNIQENDPLSLSIGEVLALYEEVSPSRTLEDISIPNDMCESTIPDAKINYTTQENERTYQSELCPFTLRPYSVDPVSEKAWWVSAEEEFGPLSGQISIYNYLIRYVTELDKIPTQEELIIWMAEKQSQREDTKDTLPKTIQINVDKAFDSFTTAVRKLFLGESSEQTTQLLEQATVFLEKATQLLGKENKFINLFQTEKSNFVDKKEDFTLADISVGLFKEVTEFSRNKENRSQLESAYQQSLKLALNDEKLKSMNEYSNAAGFFNNRQRSNSSLGEKDLLETRLTSSCG